MKRKILMFGCIISCLILVSLSFQPIIAEEKTIIKPKQEILVIEEDDCGCESKDLNIERICELLHLYSGWLTLQFLLCFLLSLISFPYFLILPIWFNVQFKANILEKLWNYFECEQFWEPSYIINFNLDDVNL